MQLYIHGSWSASYKWSCTIDTARIHTYIFSAIARVGWHLKARAGFFRSQFRFLTIHVSRNCRSGATMAQLHTHRYRCGALRTRWSPSLHFAITTYRISHLMTHAGMPVHNPDAQSSETPHACWLSSYRNSLVDRFDLDIYRGYTSANWWAKSCSSWKIKLAQRPTDIILKYFVWSCNNFCCEYRLWIGFTLSNRLLGCIWCKSAPTYKNKRTGFGVRKSMKRRGTQKSSYYTCTLASRRECYPSKWIFTRNLQHFDSNANTLAKWKAPKTSASGTKTGVRQVPRITVDESMYISTESAKFHNFSVVRLFLHPLFHLAPLVCQTYFDHSHCACVAISMWSACFCIARGYWARFSWIPSPVGSVRRGTGAGTSQMRRFDIEVSSLAQYSMLLCGAYLYLVGALNRTTIVPGTTTQVLITI